MDISIIAGTSIVKDNKILLLKQSEQEKDGEPGGWGPPAGHGEEKEKLQETAIRETKEECNLDVKISGIVKNGLFRLSDSRVLLFIVFSGEVDDFSTLKIDNEEIIDYRWVGLDELKSDKLKLRHPILKPILIEAFNTKHYPLEAFEDIDVRL